jgi:hypothetical protein
MPSTAGPCPGRRPRPRGRGAAAAAFGGGGDSRAAGGSGSLRGGRRRRRRRWKAPARAVPGAARRPGFARHGACQTRLCSLLCSSPPAGLSHGCLSPSSSRSSRAQRRAIRPRRSARCYPPSPACRSAAPATPHDTVGFIGRAWLASSLRQICRSPRAHQQARSNAAPGAPACKALRSRRWMAVPVCCCSRSAGRQRGDCQVRRGVPWACALVADWRGNGMPGQATRASTPGGQSAIATHTQAQARIKHSVHRHHRHHRNPRRARARTRDTSTINLLIL